MGNNFTTSFILFLLSITISKAQLQVKGNVKDDKGEPLPFATIMLLNSSDSSLVKGQVTNEQGLFTVDAKQAGKYFISVSAIGYSDASTSIFDLSASNSPYSLAPIIANEKVERLDEVVVRGERPLFEQKIDHTIINVQSNISRAGGSALDILQRSPGITVDKMNNSIALSGKQGVRVMINGKISRLPIEAVVQMLAGMNAENIERIELITTPPSKYEAEGDAGMINIVMKQTEDVGTNGSISAFTGYGRRGKFGGTINMNHRSKKLNLFGDATSRNDYTKEYWNSNWAIPINNEENKTDTKNNRTAFTGVNSGSLGFTWDISNKTSIGGLFSAFDRSWDMDAFANINRFIDGNFSTNVQMSTLEINDWLQLLGSINLSHQFNDKYSISFDVDHIDYNSQNPTDYVQDYFDNQDTQTNSIQLRSRKDTGIKIWTSKVDFTGSVSNKVSFETGAKGSFSKLQNDIKVDNLENGTWEPDNGLTSFADMYENIGAAYFSTTIKASQKLDLQAGLRYEHTITNIDTRTEQNVVDRNYGNWFPSLFINRKINDNNSWVLSYSRRISRPSFFQLAPFVIFNDPNSFFSGNVSLLPSFTDAVKAEYRHKSVLVSLQYSHDKNSITLFQPRVNDDNKQVSTAQNLKYKNNYSIVVSFPIQVTEWWEIQLNTIGTHQILRTEYLDNPISLSITNFSISGSQKFKVSNSVSAEISGFYNSPQYFGVWEFKAFGSLDFGIEKRFTNSSLRFSYADILQTNKWNLNANIASENLNTQNYLDFETTIATVTYAYNFGNKKLRSKSTKTGSKEEQERLRQ